MEDVEDAGGDGTDEGEGVGVGDWGGGARREVWARREFSLQPQDQTKKKGND